MILEAVAADTTLDLGDDNRIGSPSGNLAYLVTSVDRDNDWLFAEAIDPDALPDVSTTLTHVYDQPGTYTAVVDTCCRLGTADPNEHLNNPNADYRVETLVDTESGVDSPASVMPPIVQCPVTGDCEFAVPGTDPGDDGVRFRFAEPGESGIGQQPASDHDAAIDADTGEFAWDTTGASLAAAGRNTLCSAQVVIEDIDADGQLRSSSTVDFFIELSEQVGTPPVIDPAHPEAPGDAVACGTSQPATVGQQASFTAWGLDPDEAGVTLNAVGLPAGADLDPALPLSEPRLATSVFTWTPTADQTGAHPVTFTAVGAGGRMSVCPVTIEVAEDTPDHLALGDSYASGDGVTPAADGTGGEDFCFRSAGAYSHLLSDRLDTLLRFHACQGARTIDFVEPRVNRTGGDEDDWGEPAQRDHLSGGYDLVTISVGGNDAGFASVLGDCILGWNLLPFVTCHDDDDVNERVDGAFAQLGHVHGPAPDPPAVDEDGWTLDDVVAYRDIFRDIRTRAPAASSVAVGYPEFYPEDAGARVPVVGSRCAGVKRADQRWIVEKTRELNEIKADVAALYGVTFADTTPYFEGNELCGEAGDDWFFNVAQSGRFHPTGDGHEAIADAVADALDAADQLHELEVGPGGTRQLTIEVHRGWSLLHLFTVWPGSDVEATLVSPSGDQFDRHASDADVDVGENWEEIAVGDSQPGQWTVEVYGADVDGPTPVSVSVEGMEPPNEPPVAAFDWDLDLDASQLHLDASDSYDPDGDIDFYDWYIADGDVDTVAEGVDVDVDVDPEAGPWTVTLFVVDDDGASASASASTLPVDVVPDSVQPDSQGNTPVVIRSSSAFDATTLDPETLRFGPGEARLGRPGSRAVDVTGNGYDDLLVHFVTADAQLHDVDQACVKAVAAVVDADDAPQRTMVGCDRIRVVPEDTPAGGRR